MMALIFFGKLFFCYLLIFYVGNILCNIFSFNSENAFKSTFLRLFSGLFFLVTAFSSVITKGITINTGIIFLSLLFILRVKPTLKFNKSVFGISLGNIKILLNGLFPLVLFFVWRFYTLYNAQGEFPVVINMDSLKHVIRASFLLTTGIESVNVNYIVPPTGVDPYHYFEAWLIGLLGTLTRENFWVAEQLYAFPLVSATIVIGFWALISRWKPSVLLYGISVFVVLFSGFYCAQTENIKFLRYSQGFSFNAFDEWKGFVVSIAYLVSILSFNLFFSSAHKRWSLLVLLFLPFVSITLAPAILSVVTVTIFFGAFFHKKYNIDIKYSDLIYPIIVAAYIFLFYKIFEVKDVYINKPDPLASLNVLSSASLIRTRITIIVEKVIQGLVLYAPFVAVFILVLLSRFKQKINWKRHENFIQLLGFLLILLSISMFFWQVFYNSFGSSQFLFYTAMPFLNIAIFLSAVYACIYFPTLWQRGLVILLIVFSGMFFVYRSYEIHIDGKASWFDKYSSEYITEVRSGLMGLEKRYGLKIDDKKEFVKYNDMHHLVGPFLSGYFNDSYMISYTMASMYLNNEFPSSEATMLLPKAPLVVYCNKLIKDGTFVDIDSATEKLIEEEKFSFIFVSPGMELPNSLRKYVKREIVDIKSKEKLYLL